MTPARLRLPSGRTRAAFVVRQTGRMALVHYLDVAGRIVRAFVSTASLA